MATKAVAQELSPFPLCSLAGTRSGTDPTVPCILGDNNHTDMSTKGQRMEPNEDRVEQTADPIQNSYVPRFPKQLTHPQLLHQFLEN